MVDYEKMVSYTKGIYSVKCIINQKEYIGKSKNIEERIKYHKRYSKKGKNQMYQDMRLYGLNKFDFRIVRKCRNLDFWERYYIRKRNTFYSGYNLTRGGKYDNFDRKEQRIIKRWKNDF